MKSIYKILILTCSFGLAQITYSQTNSNLFPYAFNLTTLDGDTISSKTFQNDDKILLVDFWNIMCGPCIKFFDAVAENYDAWKDSTDTKIISIVSPDTDDLTVSFVKSRNWPFETYFDSNYNFFRKLSAVHDKKNLSFGVPTAFVFRQDYAIIDKLTNVKLKSVRIPKEGEQMTSDMWVVDLDYYYKLSKTWSSEK